jgi:hypothetical protein
MKAIDPSDLKESRDIDGDDLELAHQYFYLIKDKIDKKDPITEHELEHFCYMLNYSDAKYIPGLTVRDYPICTDTMV